jgi:TusA-related sulfurtransferase
MVDAIVAVDRTALAHVFAADVRLRASLPQRDVQCSDQAAAVALIAGWFEDATDIVTLERGVDNVADVLSARWRLRLRERADELVVEQQAYCSIHNGLVASVRLMCSGFRPSTPAAIAETARLEAIGEGCATLTPRIGAAMKAIRPGEVLAVLTDDPSAPDGLAAWSRLTGHEIVAAEGEAQGTRYYIRHR